MMRVECPHCGGDQLEAVLAVSTFCKNCGEHFKLSGNAKKKRGFGLFGAPKPNRSVLQPAIERTHDLPKPSFRKETEEEKEDPFAIKPAEVEMLPTRKGEGMTQKVRTKPVQIEKRPETDTSSQEPLETKRIGARSRDVPCVDCGNPLKVNDGATSTQCDRCGAYVSLEDVVVKTDLRENVKTRGNLIVQRNASLAGSQLACNNLSVFGTISGAIDCAGTALFRSSGKVVGSMRCKHLIIHKASAVEFLPGIRAETADIDGKITGDIICEKIIRISKTGSVVGDCTAPSVVLEDGGMLSGQMRFMKPDSELLAEYMRKAQAAHEDFFANDPAAG